MKPFKNLDEFADPEFIKLNQSFFDDYIKLRVHGKPAYQSFIRVFGSEHWEGVQQGHNRIEAIESTQYFLTQFDKVLEETSASDLWNAKKALHALLAASQDLNNRDAVRLAAVKDLNLLTGIVIVDENGKTRVGRTLNDFYTELEGKETPKQA
jgi:hypothetical protein